MDSFEIAKISGAVLCALLVIVGFRTVLEIASEGRTPEKPGYTLPAAAPTTPSPVPPSGAAAVPAPVDLPATPGFNANDVATTAASANAPAGGNTFKKCQTCHTGEKDGPNKVGPNLWGIVDRPRASHAGFNYSDAMKAKGGNWTLPELATFIHNPKAAVPGTKMLFPGIADSGDLSDLLAYLNTLK